MYSCQFILNSSTVRLEWPQSWLGRDSFVALRGAERFSRAKKFPLIFSLIFLALMVTAQSRIQNKEGNSSEGKEDKKEKKFIEKA